jgi:hypothetical protein
MGTDWHSYAVIGFEINVEKLYTVRDIRSCRCVVEFDENKPPNFCSLCGEDFMEEERCPIDDYDEYDKIKDLAIAFGTDQSTAFIGTISRTTSNACFDTRNRDKRAFLKIDTDVEITKQAIKNSLGDELFNTLVKPDTFGLHSVLYCSY